jgi:hypothetical protein
MPLSLDVYDLVMYRRWHSLWTSITLLCTEDDVIFGRKWLGYVQGMTLSLDVNDMVIYRGYITKSFTSKERAILCTYPSQLRPKRVSSSVHNQVIYVQRECHPLSLLCTEDDVIFGRKWLGYVQRMTLSLDVNAMVIYRGWHSLWT